MRPNVLLVFALREENPSAIFNNDVLYTGIGKIQATLALTKLLQQRHTDIDLIVNLGTAGSLTEPRGAVVHCRKFVQRDMDCTALGSAPFEVPFSTIPVVLEYGCAAPGLPEAICGSGDSFETQLQENIYSIVDMEAYALATVCKSFNKPFLCLKYLSDSADNDATTDWNTALEHAALALKNALSKIDLDTVVQSTPVV